MSSKTKEVTVVKRFVLSKNNIKDKGLVLSFTTHKGETVEYSPYKVYEQLKDKFEPMPCWNKYGNYTNRLNLPKFVRELDTLV
jgi:hypothetical protein